MPKVIDFCMFLDVCFRNCNFSFLSIFAFSSLVNKCVEFSTKAYSIVAKIQAYNVLSSYHLIMVFFNFL
nr:hypothetical protein Itr_chr14CG23200 [Ipomoea trifida]